MKALHLLSLSFACTTITHCHAHPHTFRHHRRVFRSTCVACFYPGKWPTQSYYHRHKGHRPTTTDTRRPHRTSNTRVQHSATATRYRRTQRTPTGRFRPFSTCRTPSATASVRTYTTLRDAPPRSYRHHDYNQGVHYHRRNDEDDYY